MCSCLLALSFPSFRLSVVLPVRPHVPAWHQPVGYWILLWQWVEELQIWLKSDKNVFHFTCRLKCVLLLPATWIRHKISFVQHSLFLYCRHWLDSSAVLTTQCCLYISTTVTRTLLILFHHSVVFSLSGARIFLRILLWSIPNRFSSLNVRDPFHTHVKHPVIL
jgi:hypothetical protein